MFYKDLVIRKGATKLKDISYFVYHRMDVNKIVFTSLSDEIYQEPAYNVEKVDSKKLLELFVNEHRIIADKIIEAERRLNEVKKLRTKNHSILIKLKKQMNLIDEKIEAKRILNKIESENKIDIDDDFTELFRYNNAFHKTKSVLGTNNFNIKKLKAKIDELNKEMIYIEKLFVNFQKLLNLQSS